jgi:preprotein translocase subunit SecD
MLTLSRWKVILVTLAILFGVVFTLPNVLPQKTLDGMPNWLPKQKLNLGLDLRGGSSLLMEVDTKAIKTERLTNLVEDVRTSLREQSVAFDGLHQQGDAVVVHIMNAADMDKAFPALAKLSTPIQNTAVRDLAVTTQPGQVIQLALSGQAMQAEAATAVDCRSVSSAVPDMAPAVDCSSVAAEETMETSWLTVLSKLWIEASIFCERCSFFSCSMA